MPIAIISARRFNQDTSAAKKLASAGPVFITDRGRPAHVLLTIEEFRRLSEGPVNIVDLLAMPAAAEIAFEPPRLTGAFARPAGLS